ncbi:hypothetical protein A3A66_04480 [Microgenomates group bacterium RIFCSPLOWO2_01_FULL_46_13]|nr:MAG: hypothetical protein A3A66_04480 [Microgenomates group bacterium RIFCSPLOWO2_01_FULL_46_13]
MTDRWQNQTDLFAGCAENDFLEAAASFKPEMRPEEYRVLRGAATLALPLIKGIGVLNLAGLSDGDIRRFYGGPHGLGGGRLGQVDKILERMVQLRGLDKERPKPF